MFQDVSSLPCLLWLPMTSQNLRLRKCQPRSLDWALRNVMYVSANVKVPQFPQSVDKMLEVKSDAVRIWMNSFACWAIQAIPHCFAEKPDFSQLLQVQRLEAKHGASEHFWDSFNSVEYTSRFQHISTKYCNICNSLGSRLPQNLKYSYPTTLHSTTLHYTEWHWTTPTTTTTTATITTTTTHYIILH